MKDNRSEIQEEHAVKSNDFQHVINALLNIESGIDKQSIGNAKIIACSVKKETTKIASNNIFCTGSQSLLMDEGDMDHNDFQLRNKSLQDADHSTDEESKIGDGTTAAHNVTEEGILTDLENESPSNTEACVPHRVQMGQNVPNYSLLSFKVENV
ncbi:hypothetical protein L9F63_023353, partial [Diploptera punctata]